ncbi:MAG: DUF5794 domain-containing protein [Haloarculaceae archaeon]
MSTSRHPLALSVERQVGGATELLATIMCLPLVDGIFPALVLAGALDSVTGILEVGLLVFGGSATVAVILAEMDGTRRDQVKAVLGVGAILIPVAAIEAALAPTIESLLTMAVFERFAAIVILAVAAKTASARVGEYLPRPAVIVGAGLVASVDLSAIDVAVSTLDEAVATDPELVARAVATAGVGVGFALLVALLGPRLRSVVDIDRFRFGSAVALGVLPFSIFGYFGGAPVALAVLAVTVLLAFDPDGEGIGAGEQVPAVADGGSGGRPDDADSPVEEPADDPSGDDEDDEEKKTIPENVSNYITTEKERAPWL